MQRQNFANLVRCSRVLALSMIAVMLGGLVKPEASVQPVSFGPKTEFLTGNAPVSVAVGDFNGDGKLDLAVANASSHSVSILLGTGTGSFGAKTDFETDTGSGSVAVGDFNDDGKLDLAVANIGADTVSILLGTGTGSFGAKTDYGTGSQPYSVAAADFNGDGKLDLAVTNFSSDTVSIFLGTGTGGFGVKTDFATGRIPVFVAVGDFDRDGKLDLAVANQYARTVSILLGTGTGSFGAKTDIGSDGQPESIAVGDFNGDGNLDLAVAGFSGVAVSILLGTGTGSFGAQTDFSTGGGPWSVAVGDFNIDGKLDLAVANKNAGTISILLGEGTGAFGPKTDFTTGNNESFPKSLALGDFDGDGKLDLTVANFGNVGHTVSVLLNTTPTVPSEVFCPKTNFGASVTPVSVVLGDFNRDGRLDLAVANFHDNTVSILLSTGAGTFGTKTDFATGVNPRSVAVGDFNGDGKLDLAVANLAADDPSSHNVSVLLGTGTGAFGPKSDFDTGFGPNQVAVGDFNGDGKLDLVTVNYNGPSVSILLGAGTGAFGPKTDFTTGSVPRSVAVGDFNRDGKLDLAVANSASDTVSILLGAGTGTFGAKTDFATGTNPDVVVVSDFNVDGKLDLAVANANARSISILLGTGAGSFGAKTDFGVVGGADSFAVGDINGDGKLDLAVPNPVSNSVSIMLGTGTGSFGAGTYYATGRNPESVALSDFNRDGKLDLAVPNAADDNVSILLKNTPPTITTASVSLPAGNPSVNFQIATVDDAQDTPSTLIVTINGGTSATVNGVTVTLNPTVPNSSGEVFADVVPNCSATTADFTLRVSDGCALFAESTLTIIVTPPFRLEPDHQSFAGNGGNGTVNITAATVFCVWTASTTSTFITITSENSGTGNGIVQYTVAKNFGPTIRSGTITISGQTYTVYQGIDFVDVPTSHDFYTEIGQLAARGVTLGCSSNGPRYCPNDPVLREQMSAFIMRAKGEFNPPPPASQRFGDVPPSNDFYSFIDRLAQLGITLGCQPGNPPFFCPSDIVKREQMSAFILRGLGEFNPPAPGRQRFGDVPPSNQFYNFIDRLAMLQITLGCQPGNPPLFCPNDNVTRGQMAAFLVRAFDL